MKKIILTVIAIFGCLHNAQSKHPESKEECLQCVFYVKNYNKDNKLQSMGSAFVAESNNEQWLYTNAHVIEGAKRIEIFDHKKNIVQGFGQFQCYSKDAGVSEVSAKNRQGKEAKMRYGADGIRIKLKQKRDMAFAISDDTTHLKQGSSVITIGDNDGDESMDVLDGEITTASKSIYLSTCETRPGCSGGAMIDATTYKVIGLHTWGIPGNVELVEAVWKQDADSKVAGASILNQVKWVDMPTADFFAGSDIAMKFRDTVRMLILIYYLVPQEDGMKMDLNNPIFYGVKFEDIKQEFERHPIMRPIINVNERLARGKGGIGVNNMEMVRAYSDAIKRLRENYLDLRKKTKDTLPPYFGINFDQSGYYEVGDFLHEQLEPAEMFFDKRASVGGKMPTGRWFNMKPLSEIGHYE